MMRRLAVLLAACWIAAAMPANAAVTIAFWSHDFSGSYFPHTFFTLRGTPDAGGDPVDAAYGFTARSATPAILFGTVQGLVERPTRAYMNGSDVHFATTLTDDRYAAIVALIRAWDPAQGGDGRYILGRRNCVHFVQEALRRAGLAAVDFPKLMKKPRSFLRAVGAANTGKVAMIERRGDAWLASSPPVGGGVPVPSPVADPATRRQPAS